MRYREIIRADEAYNVSDIHLLRYLRDQEIDPYTFWYEFQVWAEKFRDIADQWDGAEPDDYDEYELKEAEHARYVLKAIQAALAEQSVLAFPNGVRYMVASLEPHAVIIKYIDDETGKLSDGYTSMSQDDIRREGMTLVK